MLGQGDAEPAACCWPSTEHQEKPRLAGQARLQPSALSRWDSRSAFWPEEPHRENDVVKPPSSLLKSIIIRGGKLMPPPFYHVAICTDRSDLLARMSHSEASPSPLINQFKHCLMGYRQQWDVKDVIARDTGRSGM